MLIKQTSNKWIAARAILNILLKDTTYYCGWCGETYKEGVVCCDQPNIDTHYGHLKFLLEQNRRDREAALNDTGSTKNKSLRRSLSLPTRLLDEWETCFEFKYKEKLLGPKELTAFMKEFPQFCTCRKV